MAVAEREQEQNAERITRLRQGRDQTHTFYSQVEIGAHQRQQRLRVVNRGDAKAGAECENEDNPACVAGGKGSRCHVQCLIDAMGLFSLNATGAVAGLVVKRLYVARIGKRKMKRQERIDRIELMRTYIRIVEAGSLSAAAGQMDTTRATVSRRLQSLEGLLGVKLILRTTHAMKLTDDGERCYRHARQVVDAWLALEDDLRIADDRPVGVLRVRAPHAFGQQQLLAPLVAFLQRHPQLSVEWMLNDNTVDFLSDNIDCAIRVGAEVDPATVSVLLAEVPRCVVASPELLAKYPPLTSLEALSGLPWIAINTFYQHEVRLRHQASGQIVSTAITPV